MIRIKTFTSQLKIFRTKNELDELDETVNDFLESAGIRKVVSVSDTVTASTAGETIGIIRVVTYEEPPAGYREYQEKLESTLAEWGEEIEKIRGKAEGMGAEARKKAERQVEELRGLQAEAVRKLDELKKTGGEAWEEFRSGADAALDNLGQAISRAVGRIKGR